MIETATKTAKRLKGKVISDRMDKTVVVLVDRLVKHPKVGKYIKVSKKYKAHDEANTFKMGDVVMIEECHPISKDKHFRVVEAIAKALQ